MRKYVLYIALSLGLLLNWTDLWGQTTFSGSGNWSNPARWSAGVPDAGTAAIIANNATCTVDGDASCNSLTITGGNQISRITISGSNSLTVSGAITINPGTGTGDNKYIEVVAGTLNCSSITINATGNDNRDSWISLSTGTINVSGNITMNGGAGQNQITFSGSGILNVGGEITGGVINASTGTVNYNATGGSQAIGNYTYYNLQTSNTGIKTLGTAVVVSNNFTVNSPSTLSCGNNNVTGGGSFNLQSGASIEIGSADGLTSSGATGNIRLTGTRTYSSGANYIYNGAAAQVTGDFSPSSNPGLASLTVNNASGLRLSKAFTLTGNLVLQNGVLNLNGFDLSLSNASAISGNAPSATNMVVTGGNQLIKSFASGSTPSFVFPVGDNTGTSEYSPLTLNFNSALSTDASIGIRVSDANQGSLNSPVAATDYLSRYWTVTSSGLPATYSYQMALAYLAADVNGTAAEIKFQRWNTSSLNWDNDLTSTSAGNLLTSTAYLNQTSFPLTGDFTGRTAPVAYYSQGTDPNVLTNWNTARDGSGTNPVSFVGYNQVFVIQDTYTMTTSANWTISGNNSKLEIEQGGGLIVNNNHTVSVSGTSSTVVVLDGGSLRFNNNALLSGNAGFTLSSGANLSIFSPTGISSSGATGNIQLTGTRNYNIGANYTYAGSALQVTGNGLPASVNNLIINNSNAAGLSLTGSVIVNGILDLQQNPLVLNGQTLTLNGTVTRTGAANGTITGSTTSSMNITGTGALGTLYFTSGSETLLNLNINRTASGTIGLGTPLTVGTPASGTLTLTSGILQNGSNLVTVANVAQAAIVGGSSNSFINGPLNRSFPSSLSGSSTYHFPVGEGNVYKGFELLDTETGAGSINATVQVFPNGATTDDGSSILGMQSRNWSLNATGNLLTAKVKLTESGLALTNAIGMSTLAQSGPYSSIGGFGGATITSGIVNFTTFPVWFAIGTSNVKVLYSYQDGDWNVPTTWTLDPSGTLQVGNAVPANSDLVVILSGRTVKLTEDVVASGIDLSIESGAFLDLDAYTLTSGLLALRGQGTLKLATENFPTVITNDLVQSNGGTVEYYNSANITLPTTQPTYNHLTINAPGFMVTQLSDITLNGNLYVKQGTYRINSNSATTKLNLEIAGNVNVDNGAFLSVGNGTTNPVIGSTPTGGTAPFLAYYENFHRVVINGDFTNNGTVRFTNLTYPIYNAFPPTGSAATSGAASVYFRGETNNKLECNGTTDFYNLIVDKGSDQTYVLTVSSSNYANFRIFGANTLAAEGVVTATPNLRKALWLRNGTLILKGALIIPSLNEGTAANSQYFQSAASALILDGVDVLVNLTADNASEVDAAYGVTGTLGVTSSGANSIVLFGKLEVNSGYFSTKESSGIITNSTASGQLIINGGTFDTKQFSAANGSAAFTQTGGTMLIRGRFQRTPAAYTIAGLKDFSLTSLNNVRSDPGLETTLGSFNLEQTTSIFNMSGGIIRIFDATSTSNQEAIDIKSSPANINVTGGTIEIAPVTGSVPANDPANYQINTLASFGNFTVNRISGSSGVQLNTNPLTILNDFTLSAGSFSANNLNVTIGGNFTIEAGTTYTSGTNTTIFNGAGNQSLTVNLLSPLNLNKLTIDKPAGKTLTLSGSQEQLNVNSDFNLTLATLLDNTKSIFIAGNVFNSGVHSGTGKIRLSGTLPQTIDGGGTFGNLELFNTNVATAPVSLLSNISIDGTLNFANDRIFNLGTYNLKLNANAGFANAGADRYASTSGNAGDGGISKVFSTQGPFEFPVGVSNYTPATITFSQDPSAYGTISVVPVNYQHPNVTTINRSLTYFWRVKSSGFDLSNGTTVTHSYQYNDANVIEVGDIAEVGYVAARFNIQSNQWTSGTVDDVDDTANTIGEPGAGNFLENVAFIDGDYTAGDIDPTNPFGVLVVYYSRQSGLWGSNATWSTDPVLKHSGAAAASFPGARDIVIIGGQDSVYLSNETFPLPNNTNPAGSYYQLNKAVVNCASLQIEVGSVLDIQNNPGCNFGMVTSHINGNGNFRISTRDAVNFDNTATFVFPSGDFSDFNAGFGTTEFYNINPQAGTLTIMPSNANSYGTVILSPLQQSNIAFPNISSVSILGNLITRGSTWESWLAMTWTTGYGTIVPKTVSVKGDFLLQGGTFLFMSNGTTAQTIRVDGDVVVFPRAGIDVYGTSSANNMYIGGSLINNSNNLPAAYGGDAGSNVRFYVTATRKCDVTFFGPNNAFITNTGTTPATGSTPNTIFGKLTVNKGTSSLTTLTCNIGGLMNTGQTVSIPGSTTIQMTNDWLNLQNGTFIYNRTGDLTISTTTDFTIPATAGLLINTPSNVYIANNAGSEYLYLNGKLTLQNGTLYVGPSGNTANNADIEYAGGGFSELEISGGNLIVNGQIRRPASTTNGILKYVQSGGNVLVFGNNQLATKAKLEVLNPGSHFSMSGGTLTIVRGGGTTFGDLYLRPETSSVSGGTIYFTPEPFIGTPIDADQNYTLDASNALQNLTISGKTTGTDRVATLGLSINPLELRGNLTLSNAGLSVFNSNNRDVTIGGDFTNNGTYNFGTNLTTFDGITQEILGSSTSNFYDLKVSSGNSLTVYRNFIVNRNLEIESGNLELGPYEVNLLGNLINNGSYTDDNNTGGVSLSGSNLQFISGNGAFGRLELDNVLGARINNNISLQNNLVLTNGVLDINQFHLSLSMNSSIYGEPYNATKMIKSDGVATSKGLRKFFPKITSPFHFEFPVGVTGKYTPAIFDISANNAVGAINVTPINAYHPTVIESDSVLQYYWQIESSGISGFTGSMFLDYLQIDVKGIESEYVAARLELPGDYWYKAAEGSATDNVDEDVNRITFTSGGSSNLSADYTAGKWSAIPEQVPTYVTVADGDWSDRNIWNGVGTAPPCPDGGPNGAIVIIEHVVTTTTNYCTAYRTTINNELRVVSPTFGHNLGKVDGINGTIYLESGNLPAGNYASFLDCDGNGTLIYGGTGNYANIASLYNSVPNLIFSGTGTRTLYNKDLTICKRMVIDGPVLDNSVNNKKFTILGTMELYNSGSFISGSGNAPAATVTFAGNALQTLGGMLGNFTGTNSFNNLEIDNPFGLTIGDNGLIQVKNNLLLTDGIIETSSSNKLTVSNLSSLAVIPEGGSTSSYINGPLVKQIANGESFLFPIGKENLKGHDFTVTSAAGSSLYWTGEFFTPNNTATSLTLPLLTSNTIEYWSLSSSSNAGAYVKIGWDSQSNLTPAMTQNGMVDMRLAEYDLNTNSWIEIAPQVTSGSETLGDVTSSSLVNISNVAKNYTTASVTTTTPSVRLSPTGPVCGNAGIPVTVTSFFPITFPYTLSYTIDGLAQTPVVINALPYSLPTPVQGAYQLTGFTYSGGSPGIIDNAIVNAYTIPTTANAGPDQSMCGESGTILAGNDPAPYVGTWSIVSGTGGTIFNSNSANSAFAGVLDQNYVLRWTIQNATCISTDEVSIEFNIFPALPSNFTAAVTPVCLESTGNVYTVPAASGVSSYIWEYSGAGATINGTGNSVTVDFDGSATNGILSVKGSNVCGQGPARTLSIVVNPRGSWLGAYNNNWFDTRNWTCPGIPLNTSDVIIPSTASFMPVINNTGAVCNSIEIQTGASITITSGNNLAIYGDFENNGTFNAAATSTVNFEGNTFIYGTSVNSFGNVTVNGTLTSASGTVNVAGNWTNPGVFNHNDGTVNFNGVNQRITGPSGVLTFNNLGISAGSTVSVDQNTRISVNSNTVIDGTFVLESPLNNGASASFISYGSVSGIGAANIQRYLTDHLYHYISSPIQSGGNANSQLFTSFGSNFNPNFYWYDESVDLDNNPGTAPLPYNQDNLAAGWKFMQRYNYSPVLPMEVTKGYSFYGDLSGLRTFIGMPNTGDMSVTGLGYHNNDNVAGPLPAFYDGWHLVGNPYPSAIDWDAMSGGFTNIDNAIYVWNGSSYGSYIAGSGGIGTNGQTNIIAPMQGFFVHAFADNGGFALNNSHRVHNSTTTFKNASSKSAYTDLVKLKLTTATGKTDETIVYFNLSASSGFDRQFDALAKFAWNKQSYPGYYNYEDIPTLYSLSGQELIQMAISAFSPGSINGLIVPIGIRLGTSGRLTISASELNMTGSNVYLIDKQENKTTYLNDEGSYSFDFLKGEVSDRFELRFNENHAPVAVNCLENKVYSENEQFSFDFAESLFVENDEGDRIVNYIVRKSDGSELPAWLKFDPTTRAFTGKPGYADAGTFSIKLGAIDVPGAIGNCEFTITVNNQNQPPLLGESIPDQEVDENDVFAYIIPFDAFVELDLDDQLSFSAKLADGSNLPAWLGFNSEEKLFYGIAQNPGSMLIQVTATDNSGSLVSSEFNLTVKSVTGIDTQDEISVKISPNPTTGLLFIEGGPQKAGLKYMIKDHLGRILLKNSIESKLTTVDLRNLADGLYFVEIIDQIGSKVYKVILQK